MGMNVKRQKPNGERKPQLVRGKPIKIAADFDTALAALIAVPLPKKRRKAGRP